MAMKLLCSDTEAILLFIFNQQLLRQYSGIWQLPAYVNWATTASQPEDHYRLQW